MCGIFLSIAQDEPVPPNEGLLSRLKSRGPDHHSNVRLKLDRTLLSVHATVLSLRGLGITSQPLYDLGPDGDFQTVLCWNGEAWKIGGVPVKGNDTDAVMTLLQQASSNDYQARVHDVVRSDVYAWFSNSHLLRALRSIEGPFAFTYIDVRNRCLVFGRDRLGRRSLLRRCDAGCISIASVGDGATGWDEIKANTLNVIDLDRSESMHSVVVDLHPSPSPYRLESNNDQSDLDLTSPAVQSLEGKLFQSLKLRSDSVPSPTDKDPGARMAVLFSGGLDCSVLACLLTSILPVHEPIDLLNVTFENPRTMQNLQTQSTQSEPLSPYEVCPDRITARAALAELQHLHPDRYWRLVTIDIPYKQMLEHRATVQSLMSPHATEMDLSITLALYFAARATGTASQEPYTTPARVLLSGLGADELLAGYGHHARAHATLGRPGLLDALSNDIRNIGARNCGRDDRVTAHWAREVRYPFLDEDVVAWAMAAPLEDKCALNAPDRPDGLPGDKLVLRLLAERLGMRRAAREKKRAVQFGARSARMEVGGGRRVRGTDRLA